MQSLGRPAVRELLQRLVGIDVDSPERFVLKQQSAVRLKVLAGLVTGAMWLLTGLTAYMAPADSDCVSVCAVNTTA